MLDPLPALPLGPRILLCSMLRFKDKVPLRLGNRLPGTLSAACRLLLTASGHAAPSRLSSTPPPETLPEMLPEMLPETLRSRRSPNRALPRLRLSLHRASHSPSLHASPSSLERLAPQTHPPTAATPRKKRNPQ